MQIKDSWFNRIPSDEIIKASKEITCEWRKIEDSKNNIIIEFMFGGEYPLGSAGKPHAAVMGQYIYKILMEVTPAGVIFNFTNLNYRWGDGIANLFWALRDFDSEDVSFPIHACMVAKGETAKALEWFCSEMTIFAVLGLKIRLFGSTRDGQHYLEKQLKNSKK